MIAGRPREGERVIVDHEMNVQITGVLAGTAALGSDVKGSLPGKIWRHIKSRFDSFSDKPENIAKREEPEGGER